MIRLVARVVAEPSGLETPRINAAQGEGMNTTSETTVVAISGMHCQNCATSVTAVLSALPGVQRVEVSFDSGQARIAYDPSVAKRSDFEEAIGDAGFETA